MGTDWNKNRMRARTGLNRRGRFDTRWSVLNAKLGGYEWREHPNLMMLAHYSVIAPLFAPPKQWAKFMRWFEHRYQEVWDNGGSSWRPH